MPVLSMAGHAALGFEAKRKRRASYSAGYPSTAASAGLAAREAGAPMRALPVLPLTSSGPAPAFQRATKGLMEHQMRQGGQASQGGGEGRGGMLRSVVSRGRMSVLEVTARSLSVGAAQLAALRKVRERSQQHRLLLPLMPLCMQMPLLCAAGLPE